MMKRLIIAFIVLCSFQAQAAFNVGDFIGGLFSDDEEYIETTQKIFMLYSKRKCPIGKNGKPNLKE